MKGGDAIRDLVDTLREEVVQLKGELETCKAQLAQGAMAFVGEPSAVRGELAKLKAEMDALRAQGAVGATVTASRVDVPRPEAYRGARKAREIENFLYGLERYFETLGIMGDDARLHIALLYLKDSALIW